LNDIESLGIQGKYSSSDELEDIFIELLRFLNISSLGQTILNSYQTYFLDLIRQSQNSLTMLPLFASVCRTLKDRHRKILFSEILFYIYFQYDPKSDWSLIFQYFEQNHDLTNFSIDDYIQLCCEYNAFLTLYLYSEYELTLNKQVQHDQILNLEYKYLENLINLLTNGKLRIVHGEEERVLVLMMKIHRIIVHQLEYGRGTDVLLTRLIRNYACWLLALGTDNKEYAYAGLFAIIGIGKKAQYSLR